MNSLMPQHRILAIVAAVALVGYLLGQFFVCRPTAEHVAELEEIVTGKRKHLLQQGWPLDHGLLQQTQAEKRRAAETLKQRKTDVFDRVVAAFNERIVSLHETRHHFRTQVSRLYFQEEFTRIESKFNARGIVFDERILHLHEDAAWPYTYQMVLQLWTLEASLDRALQHNLQPIMTPIPNSQVHRPDQPDAERPRASAVSVLAPVAYILDAQPGSPYLLEFRVRFTLQGNLNDLLAFLHETQTGQPFIAVDRIEIRAFPPTTADASPNTVCTDLQCSTIFPLTETE